MKIQIKLDRQAIRQIENAARESAVEAIEKVHAEITNTVPLDQGGLMNSIFASDESDDNGIHVKLDHSMIYARYLYYGLKMVDSETGKGAKRKVKQPEEKLQFKNDRTDHWLEPYINGDKKDFVRTEFTKIFKEKSGI